MNYLILAFLTLLPWANFIFRDMNLWLAQGHFTQLSVLAMFACSFFIKPNCQKVKNIPLALLVFWVGAQTLHFSAIAAKQNGYSLAMLSFFNFICLIIFYRMCVRYLNKEDVKRILKYVSFSVIGMLFFVVLQKYQLSQYTKEMPGTWHPDKSKVFIAGLIGHPTQLAAYLGMCLPLFYRKKLIYILAAVLSWIIIFFWTGMSYTISASGVVIGLLVTAYYLFKTNKKLLVALIILLSISAPFALKGSHRDFLSSSGRIAVWEKYFNESKDKFLTGRGLGIIRIMSRESKSRVRMEHAHNEFIHYHFELGFIGLLAILFVIFEWFKLKIKESQTVIIIKSVFVGFLLNAMIIYPSHVWVVAGLAMFLYASLYVIKNEELRCQ